MKQQNNINELMEKIDKLQNQFEEVQKMIAEIKSSQTNTKQIGLEVLKAAEKHKHNMRHLGEKQ